MVMPRCVPPGSCGWNGPGVVRTSSDIRAELADRVVRYEITETFRNMGGGLGEADYLFPLPSGAAFKDLKLSINGEMVSGEALDAQEARGVYEEIVRRRRDPALVEWMGFGLLRARIFPIAAGEEKRVVVRFQTVAPREGDAVRIDYLLGGRNETGARMWPAVATRPLIRLGAEIPSDQWTFTLSYPTGDHYGPAYSPTHAIATEDAGDRRIVRATGTGQDLTILLPVPRHDGASVSVLPYAPGGTDGYALITVTPPAIREAATPRDVTLVIDVSGSMGGRKIEQARAAGHQLLATLSPHDRFRLIDFSTDVRSFRDDFVFATPANIHAAETYLDDLDADGSTNLAGALAAALARPVEAGSMLRGEPSDTTRLRLVLFVTDGEPTVGERNPDAIVAHAVEQLHHTRLFTFGLGADVNAPLLEQLALQGHGTAQFVRPEESVERAVSLVAHRLTNPVVTDLTVATEGAHLEHTSPDGAVDLFAGQDLVLLTRYRGTGRTQFRFTGHSSTGAVTWTSTADFPERDRRNAFVARLWATQRLGYLTAERRRSGGSSEIDAEIKALGEEYGIPTEFTSYLVCEPTAVALQSGPRPDDQGIAPAAPRGQAWGVAGGMARSDRTFEAAKASATQRSATSLATLDSVAAMAPGAGGGNSMRRAGDRTLMWQDSVWVDTRYHMGVRIVRVAPYSAAYFALLDALPDLRAEFAVADRIRIAGRAVAIEITPAGVAEFDAGELADIRAAW